MLSPILRVPSIVVPAPPFTGPYILDTRAGGAQDVTAATTLAAAEAIALTSHQNGPAAVYWTNSAGTPFGPLGSGNNWAIPWTGGVANPMFVNKAGMDFTGIYRCHWRTWRGRVAGDAVGLGGVGAYALDSHKWGVLFKRSKTGGVSVNDDRITTLFFTDTTPTNHGAQIDVDNYVHKKGQLVGGNTATVLNDNGGLVATANQFASNGTTLIYTLEIYDGTGAVESAVIQSHTASPNVVFTLASGLAIVPDATSKYNIYNAASSASPPPFWGEATYLQDNTAGNAFGGVGTPLDLSTVLNQPNDVCWEFVPESAPGAGDGRLRYWLTVAGVTYLMMDANGAVHAGIGRAGTEPWKEQQIMGPTFNNPSASCTQYMDNYVIENPAAPAPG